MSRTTWTYSTACVILYTYSLTLLFQIHDKRSLLELSNLESRAYLHAEFQQGFTDSQTMTTSAVVLLHNFMEFKKECQPHILA